MIPLVVDFPQAGDPARTPRPRTDVGILTVAVPLQFPTGFPPISCPRHEWRNFPRKPGRSRDKAWLDDDAAMSKLFGFDDEVARRELVAAVTRRLLIVILGFALMAAARAEERVVSLAPSVTETILALGLEDRLIARTRYCPGSDRSGLVIFEDMVQPSVERLLSLRPDLILASDPTPEPVVAQLRKVRLRAERMPTSDLASVVANLRRTGELLGEPAKGKALADGVQEQLTEVDRNVAEVPGDKRPRVVLFYGTDTAFCAGAGSFTGELLERAGGRNVAADADTAWPALNRERLLSWNPEVILISLTDNPADLAAARAAVGKWKDDVLWSRLAAVQSGRIVFVTGSLLMIPGPRVGDAALAVAEALHPGLISGAHSDELHFLQP